MEKTEKGKIAFIIHGLVVGGSEMFFVNLVNGFQDNGYQPIVILLSEHNPLADKLNPKIQVKILKRRFRFDLGVSIRIRQYIIRQNITRVFCVELFSFFLSKNAFLFDNKVSFILSVHNSVPITRKKYLLDLIYLRFFQKKDKVIFVCDFQKECYKKRYFFDPEKTFVIYNGIDVNHYSRQTTLREIGPHGLTWKGELKLNDRDKIIVITGRLALEKGHLFAISALARLHSDFNNPAHLVLVGGGTPAFEKILHEASKKSGKSDYIHFVGSRKDVRPYLYFADVFTLTSFSETFSIAALEALSMGVPCSLTNVGGAPEMIVNEQIGMLCESRNESSIAGTWNELLCKNIDKSYISKYASDSFSFDKMLQAYLSVVN